MMAKAGDVWMSAAVNEATRHARSLSFRVIATSLGFSDAHHPMGSMSSRTFRRRALRVHTRGVDSVGFVADEGFRIELDGERGARLTGELDLGTYDAAMAGLAELFEASGDVSLDLADLTFVDSSGIRLFILLHQSLGERGRLVLRDPTPHVAGILEISGLDVLGVRLERDPG